MALGYMRYEFQLGIRKEELGMKIRLWARGVVMVFTDVMVNGYRNWHFSRIVRVVK